MQIKGYFVLPRKAVSDYSMRNTTCALIERPPGNRDQAVPLCQRIGNSFGNGFPDIGKIPGRRHRIGRLEAGRKWAAVSKRLVIIDPYSKYRLCSEIRTLFRLHACKTNQRLPHLEFSRNKRAKFLRSRNGWFSAHLRDAGSKLPRSKNFYQIATQPIEHCGRQVGRPEDTHPGDRFKVFEPCFPSDRWQPWSERRALRGCDRDGLESTALQHAAGGGKVEHRKVDLTADDAGVGLGSCLVGDPDHIKRHAVDERRSSDLPGATGVGITHFFELARA